MKSLMILFEVKNFKDLCVLVTAPGNCMKCKKSKYFYAEAKDNKYFEIYVFR